MAPEHHARGQLGRTRRLQPCQQCRALSFVHPPPFLPPSLFFSFAHHTHAFLLTSRLLSWTRLVRDSSLRASAEAGCVTSSPVTPTSSDCAS
jgi:hypothetical protein